MTPPAGSQNLTAALGLRQLILDAELCAGDRLSELRLSERLGVSRTPLRLALAQLAHEGLLETLATGGFAVRSFSAAQVSDAIDLRGVLEGTAARLAAERALDPRDLSGLIGVVAQLDRVIRPARTQAADFQLYVAFNEQFHTELVSLAASDALTGAYDHALALPFASPSAFVMAQAELTESHRILDIAQRQHHGILDAIEHGEGTRAEAIGREHARLARANLDAALGSERVLAQLPGAGLIRLEASAAS